MPTYEYECAKCGHAFEQFQRMTEEPLKKCPKCKGKVKRLLGTGSGIIFKGSGFYETDYKKKSGSPSTSTSTTSEKAKSESAPATPSSTTASTATSATAKKKDTTS